MSTATAPSASPPAVGTPAPDFTLASTSGEKVSLSSFRGRQHVLLAFFPLAFTSTCTEEMCAFRDDWDEFAKHDVAVLPISVDATPSLTAYRDQYELKTELLSDFKREVSRLYGVLNEERFMSKRAYFLIDREGVLRWSHVEEHGGLRRENAEILAEVAKL